MNDGKDDVDGDDYGYELTVKKGKAVRCQMSDVRGWIRRFP